MRVEILQNDAGLVAESAQPVKRNTATKLAPPLAANADQQTALRQVVDYYHQTLKASPEALAYLESRGLNQRRAIDHFKIGFANRTLGCGLPERTARPAPRFRGELQASASCASRATSTSTARWSCRSSTSTAHVTEIYGRKLACGTSCARARPAPLPARSASRACGTCQALKASKEIILCEALIDALTFWCAGYRNVTASYGVRGLYRRPPGRPSRRHGIERVLIAYDRDEAGNRAAETLAAKRLTEGHRRLPHRVPARAWTPTSTR